MEKEVANVVANILVSNKVKGQDIRALCDRGVPAIDLMLSVVDVPLFAKAIIDWCEELQTK